MFNMLRQFYGKRGPCRLPLTAGGPMLVALLLTFLFSSMNVGRSQNNEATGKPLKVLFLGDQGHHRPADLYRVLGPSMKKFSIELTYSED